MADNFYPTIEAWLECPRCQQKGSHLVRPIGLTDAARCPYCGYYTAIWVPYKEKWVITHAGKRAGQYTYSELTDFELATI